MKFELCVNDFFLEIVLSAFDQKGATLKLNRLRLYILSFTIYGYLGLTRLAVMHSQ